MRIQWMPHTFWPVWMQPRKPHHCPIITPVITAFCPPTSTARSTVASTTSASPSGPTPSWPWPRPRKSFAGADPDYLFWALLHHHLRHCLAEERRLNPCEPANPGQRFPLSTSIAPRVSLVITRVLQAADAAKRWPLMGNITAQVQSQGHKTGMQAVSQKSKKARVKANPAPLLIFNVPKKEKRNK